MAEDSNTQKIKHSFKELKYWRENYYHPEAGDQRAINDFMEIESREKIQSLRSEFFNIYKGGADPKVLKSIIGAKMLNQHENYKAWAKVVLRWIAEYKG